MIVDNLMDKLPDVYNKTEQSGVYKIIKLAADQIEKGEATLRLIQEWRDIDQAQGKTLDKLGKDVGQVREGLDDEQYRQVIKIKIRSNLSGGEIETLNSIAIVLLDERFEGIQEGWTLPANHPLGKTPAMMLFTVYADGIHYGIPMAEIDQISGGGVAANWELLIRHSVDMAQTDFQHWSAPYPMTNELTAGIDQQQGTITEMTVEIETRIFASTNELPTAGAEQMQGHHAALSVEASAQHVASMHNLLTAGAAKAGEGVLV